MERVTLQRKIIHSSNFQPGYCPKLFTQPRDLLGDADFCKEILPHVGTNVDVVGFDKAIADPNSCKLHDCCVNYDPRIHQFAQFGSDASHAKDLVSSSNHFRASCHVTADHELAERCRSYSFKQFTVSGWRVFTRFHIPKEYIAGLGVVVCAAQRPMCGSFKHRFVCR